MAEPSAEGPLTDTELSALVSKRKQLKPEEIDSIISSLSDDEILRLDRLTQPNPKAKDPTKTDPLAGKPTLAQFERDKAVAETPRVGLPAYPGQRPEMPQEGPSDIKGFLQSIAAAAGSGADRPGPVEDAPSEPIPAADAEMNDPIALAQRVRAEQDKRIGANQPMSIYAGAGPSDPESNAVLGQMAVQVLPEMVASFAEFVADPVKQLKTRPIEFGGNAIQAAVWLHGAAIVARTAKEIAATKAAIRAMPPEEIAGAQAVLETKLDEMAQAKDLNRATTQDPEITQRIRDLEARVVNMRETLAENAAPAVEAPKVVEPPVVEPPVENIPVLKSEAQVKLERLQKELSDLGPEPRKPSGERKRFGAKGVAGADPSEVAQWRQEVKAHESWRRKWSKLKKQEVEASNEVFREAKAGKQAAPIISDAAKATTKLPQALAMTPGGSILLAGAAQDDQQDPTPRAGSPFSAKHPIWTAAAVAGGAGILGYGAFRYFNKFHPDKIAKAKSYVKAVGTEAKSFVWDDAKTGKQDLERFAETVMSPLFPDTPISQSIPRVIGGGTIAGTIFGAGVGSQLGRDEFSPLGAAGGAITGAMMGSVFGNSFARMFATNKTYRTLYREWMKEGGILPAGIVSEKTARRISLEGRVREIKDVVREARKFDEATQEQMQAYMSGQLAPGILPAKAQDVADHMRLIFDEHSMDLLSLGLIEDGILADKVQSNIGTYVPRLYLRYELDNGPTERVAQWLKSNDETWGRLSKQDYAKPRQGIPEDVRVAMGEIKDNPAYLLSKRGVITAADIEHARYQRFILSSPEYSIPEDVIEEGVKANKAFNRLRREDYLANKARASADKLAAGEFPAGDLMPGVDESLRAKAEARIGQGTIKSAYEHLEDGSVHPKFFNAEDGAPAAIWDGRSYVKMPENKRWGILSGRYVEASVASDMMGVHETVSGLSSLLDAGLAPFKFFKAVLNPASQIRNMVSNVILADLNAGIGFGPWNWMKWKRGFTDLKNGTDWYKRARRAGTFGGEFTQAEMMSYLEPGMEGSNSIMEHIGKNVPHFAQKAADAGPEAFTKWHQASEAWARQTVFRQAVEKMGMDDVAAAKFARQTIPDYQDVPRWVKVVRKSPFGAPFISFSYKALPVTLKSAFAVGDPKRMMGFWKYPLAMAAINEYSAQKFGLLGKDEKTDVFSTLRRMTYRTMSAGLYQPEAWNTFRKYLPGHVGKMQITIPYPDAFGRPMDFDGTFWLPWGDAGEMGKGPVGQGLDIPFLPRQLEPSNPWFQLGVAAVTGKDSFTGKDIIPAGAVGGEQIAAMGQFLMRSWGPSLAPGAGYGAQSLQRSFSGKFDGSPEVKSEMAAVAADILGARTRPVDPATSYKFKYFEFKKELASVKAEILSAVRGMGPDAELTPEVLDGILANKPDAKLSRAVARYKKLALEFSEKYEDVPPSPQKLVDAIQREKK